MAHISKSPLSSKHHLKHYPETELFQFLYPNNGKIKGNHYCHNQFHLISKCTDRLRCLILAKSLSLSENIRSKKQSRGDNNRTKRNYFTHRCTSNLIMNSKPCKQKNYIASRIKDQKF